MKKETEVIMSEEITDNGYMLKVNYIEWKKN